MVLLMHLRSPFQYKETFPVYGIPVLKIRRSGDRLIFSRGIPILVRRHFYIETTPRFRLFRGG